MSTTENRSSSESVTGTVVGPRVLYLLLMILMGLGSTSCKKDIEVEVEASQRRTLMARISESGIIQPDVEVPIAPDVSGEVTAIYVQEGQAVKKGDLLFEIRPDNYQAALEQSRAALNSARADHANALASVKQAEANLLQDSVNFVRNQTLYEKEAISKADYENFRLRYQVSRSALEGAKQAVNAAYYRIQNAKASLKQARDNLIRTRVYASMDGIVTALNVRKGQRVVGTGMMAGTEAIRIADLSRMEVVVMINENDIVQLRIGDTAQVEVDAYPERTFRGRVTDIAFSADVAAEGSTDQITNYEVQVLIIPESYQADSVLMRNVMSGQSPFRPGMSAVVNIFTERADQVVSIPIQAVTIDREEVGTNTDPSQREIVFLLQQDNTVKSQRVKTGITDDTYIEVEEGLQPNQPVVIGPYSTVTKVLKDGMQVVEQGKDADRAEE